MQAVSGVQQPVSLSPAEAQGQPSQQQPVQGQVPEGQACSVEMTESKWEVNLCDCCAGGCASFLYAWCCGGCSNASARTNMDGSDWCFNCFCILNPCAARNIIREGYNIEGNCWSDICLSWCCTSCSTCQIYNESSKRKRATGMFGENRSEVEIPWNNGLFSMFEHCGTCLLGFFCAPCTYAYARSKFDDSDCLFNFYCIGPCLTRSIIREGYNIEGSCWGDFCIPIFCLNCVACQIMNEVKSRGNVHGAVVSVASQSMAR